MSRSIWHREAEVDLQADVCIVGAGIMGASTAYWLRRLEPDADILLLDARWPAYGASGRNAGFLLQGAVTDYETDIGLYGLERARALRTYTHENRDLLCEHLEADAFSFTPSGSLTIAGTAEEQERLIRSVSLMARDGFEARYLDAREVNAVLASRNYLGGLLTPSGGMLDPVELVNQLVARSEAALRTHARVQAAESGLVEGDGFRVRADRIVLTPGPWLPSVLPQARAWVTPVRAQMLAFQPAIRPALPLPVYSHEGYYYIRPDAHGRVLLGGARHLHRDQEVGFDDRTTTALQADLLRYAVQHFPELATAPVVRRWAGTMGFSPDGLPVIGPTGTGIWSATGFTGHGMAYGFRTGLLLARLVRGDTDEASGLFSASRLSG